MEIINAECLQIRIPDKPGVNPVLYEQVNKSELFWEVETVVEVYTEVMEEEDLGRALNSIERISIFLNARRKRISEDNCIGGCNVFQTMAISDIEELGNRFIGHVGRNSSETPAPVPAPAPASGPGPGLIPAATLPRVFLVMEQRPLA